jgi:hypothetical protein
MVGSAFMALAIVASAIQWGWQKLDDGGEEYIVQVEPQLTDLDTFRKQGFASYVPPGLRDIRRIRIVVGSDPLPNEGDMNPVGLRPIAPPAASQSPPTAPGTLPAGMAAQPLKSARPPLESPTAKVALTDGHQAAANAESGAEPSGKSAKAAAARAMLPSPSDEPAGERPASSTATSGVASSASPPRPWLTLLLVTAGLIVSLSGNVFLSWIHWGTRNQYRALVGRLRSQRSE